MPLKLIHPALSEDKRTELQEYLKTQWDRAKEGRATQIDGNYAMWSDAYEGVPLESVRTVPFYKSSNLVVKLIRIYIDTFVARTLNIMYATKPLYTIDGLDKEYKDECELYLNRKASYDWQHYKVARALCFRGTKNGTVVFKHPYVDDKSIDIVVDSSNPSGFTEREVSIYTGPRTLPIPFEDFYVYPLEINCLEDAVIKFHRTRYVKEIAQDKVDSKEWKLPEDKTIDLYLHKRTDAKSTREQSNSGVTDSYTAELKVIEAHTKYAIMEDGIKKYRVVVLFEEDSGDLFDVYFDPYPCNAPAFTDYRPFPREDFYWGESLGEILGQCQEEASCIHNERRNNSTIASTVFFKRKSGSLLPNPSTNFYPGKVFDLEDMDDLEVVTIGRNYDDMMAQEDYVFNFADRLSGIGEVMQASSTGSMNKRGIYNTSGTLAVMAEGNQRQDTNIRDVREAMGTIGLVSLRLQATFDPNDPLIDTLPESCRDKVRKALAYIASPAARYLRLEVKASDAGVNAEVKKANLVAMAQAINSYIVTIQQLSAELMNQSLNPGMRMLLNDIRVMQEDVVKLFLKAYNESDYIDDLPDVSAAIEAIIPGGSRGSKSPSTQPSLPAPQPRAGQAAQGPPQGGGMEGVRNLLGGPTPALNGAGVGPQNLQGAI